MNRGKEFQSRIGWLFVLSNAANIVWIFVWQFEYFAVSVVVIFLLLASLVSIYLRVGIGRSAVTVREKLAVHLPFSVYFGWITVASIANVAVTVVSMRLGSLGTSPVIWAGLAVVVALLVTILVLATRKDVAYALVIIWALLGIAVMQGGTRLIVTLTEASTGIIAIALVATVLLTMFRRR